MNACDERTEGGTVQARERFWVGQLLQLDSASIAGARSLGGKVGDVLYYLSISCDCSVALLGNFFKAFINYTIVDAHFII